MTKKKAKIKKIPRSSQKQSTKTLKKTQDQASKNKPPVKRGIVSLAQRGAGELANKEVIRFGSESLDLLKGKGLPPVTPKPISHEGDYGQFVADPKKEHLTVKGLITALQKVKHPEKTKVWIDGSQYWGQVCNVRTFQEGRCVLLEKRN